jgi:hypothetical protein
MTTSRTQSAYGNEAARLPALPTVRLTDPQMQRFVDALRSWVETRDGTRDKLERVVTMRDLVQLGMVEGSDITRRSMAPGSPGTTTPPSVLVETPGGRLTMSMEAFAKSIYDTALFRDLMKRLDDPTRFDRLPAEIKAILLRDIAEEAARRGAEIRRLEGKIQESNKSLAYTVAEVTAAVDGSMAGVRETVFAYATEGAAQAGKITQIQARIDGVEINPDSIDGTVYTDLTDLETSVPTGVRGIYYQVDNATSDLNDLYIWNGTEYVLAGRGTTALGGTATLEEQMTASASRSEGLEAQYTLKVSAGRAVAGFGIAATERDGVAESAFIIQADKFALTSSYDFVQESTPSAVAIGDSWYKPSTGIAYRATATGTGNWVSYTPVIPFGVDMDTGNVWINGNVRIATGAGTALNSVGAGESNVIIFAYRRSASAPTAPSVDATYNFTTKALTGLNNSWTATIPAGADPLYIIAATATSTTSTDTIVPGDWTTPVIFAQDGAAASAGANSAVAYLYRRTATSTPPSTPSGASPTYDLTYTFATGALTGTPPTDWTITIPATGGDYLWESRAVAFAVATFDTILPSEWSAPKLFSQNGIAGGAGKSTYLATVFTRHTTTPAAPVTGSGAFDFGANPPVLTVPTSAAPGSYTWWAGVPAGTNPVYVSTFLFSIAGDSGSQTAGTWSTPVLYVQNGASGNYTSYVFKRAPATPVPTKPVAADPTAEGWLDAPPAANGSPLWASLGEFTGTGTLVGVWSDAVQIEGGAFQVQYSATTSGPWSSTFIDGVHLYAQYSTQNGIAGSWSASVKIVGEDGDPGPAGTSTYLYSVFKRDTASASTPTGGSYDFGTNTGTPPAGWSNSAPAGGNQLFMSTAKVVGATPTSIVDPITGWSAPAPVANRGSLTAYSDSTVAYSLAALTSANPWNGVTDDRLAAKIIWILLGNSAASFDAAPTTISHLVPGDTVTLRNAASTDAATRMWSSAAWIDPGVVIDGNLVVNGTIGADKINANGLSIKDTSGNTILLAGSSVAASTFGGSVIGTVNGTAAATVVSNAGNGATAFTGTAQYRSTGAPTNNPTPTDILSTTNSNGTVDIRLTWGSYTQGALKADMLLLFWRQDTLAPTVFDSCIAFNVNTGNPSYYIFEGVNPSNTYSAGIAAARRTENGLEIGPIQAPTAAPDWRGVTNGTPNYTANIDGATASSVRTTAAAANAAVADMAADNKLTPVEKQSIRGEWDVLYAERAGLISNATAVGVTTESTNYQTAYNTLGTYLNAGTGYTAGTTPPFWITDGQLSVTTDITGATFRSNVATFYTSRQALINKIAEVASTKATGSNLTGSGVPSSGLGSNGDSYYDTTNNLLYGKWGGAWTRIGAGQITTGNFTTYIASGAIGTAAIANAAIGTAQIADLNVSTIKIANNAVTIPVGATSTTAQTITAASEATATIVGTVNYVIDAGTTPSSNQLIIAAISTEGTGTGTCVGVLLVERVLSGVPTRLIDFYFHCNGAERIAVTVPFMDSVALVAGNTYTYRIRLWKASGTGDLVKNGSTIAVLGAKK